MRKLILAAMIAMFGAAVVLPTMSTFDSAYAATKKTDKKKKTAKEPTEKPATKSAY